MSSLGYLKCSWLVIERLHMVLFWGWGWGGGVAIGCPSQYVA